MPHPAHLRALAAFAVLVCACASASAQAPQQREAPASVGGRIRVGERGAAGIAVAVMPVEPTTNFRAAGRAKTDVEGRYKISDLTPGRYRVVPYAPAHVLPEGTARGMGLLVTLAPGETVDDADFTLTRGGVITGRVTDAEGRAVVGEAVRISSVEDDNRAAERATFGNTSRQTDDRGVYRVYGLPAGRYRVSVGDEPNGRFLGLGGRARGYYVRTYHPNTTDAAHAQVVEVTEGGEAADVDITLGRLAKSFKASGRVVNAATGQPVGGVTFAYGVIEPRGGRLMGAGLRAQTNARGEFQVEGLLPGTYGAYASPEGTGGDTYSDVATFQITDADVSGLEVRLRPGASASGVVAIEGLGDPARAAQLFRGLTVTVYPDQRQGAAAPRFERVQVNPDGTFTAKGLRPGKNFFGMGYPPVRGLTLLRTELNGVEQRGGFEVAEGSHLTGVRLVFAYGTGRVRVQVVVLEGGQPAAMPEGTRLSLYRRVGARANFQMAGELDTRGRIVVENLPPGEVELMVQASGRYTGKTTQTVVVSDGGESSVTMTLDLTPRAPRAAPPANP